jgi:hypothetical protein
MRSFLTAIVAAIVLAIGFSLVLGAFQNSVESEFHTVSARP